jgi:hypothetical protein
MVFAKIHREESIVEALSGNMAQVRGDRKE